MKNCDLVIVSSLVFMFLLIFSGNIVTVFHLLRERRKKLRGRVWKRSTSGVEDCERLGLLLLFLLLFFITKLINFKN